MSRPSPPTASNTIRLREYQTRDFDALCELDRTCFSPDIAYSRREMRAYLNAPGADCVVAENDNGIVGFCITARGKRRAYIVTIDMIEAMRKRGIGGALLVEAEERLAAKGVSAIALDTATDNVSAIAFWQKHGYRKIGIRKGYYPNGRDAFAMTKRIAR
ncbi:MAG TPA: N-acetyltransferase, partial [Candidatus Acidoferrales bacterium]|nr:N-acetyltransferase [Candidatus Acidoferrales bacterium]